MGEKNRRDDWRGWRFVAISLGVTLSCGIFFFSVRELFPNIGPQTRMVWGELSQRVIEWGGIRLKNIELQSLADSEQGQLMAPFESHLTQLKEELSVYYGSPFWSLNLSKVKEQILADGWVKTVYLRRSFPESLKIQVIPKIPVLLVRNSQGWVAVDEEGSPLLISAQVPGAWLGLTMVYGLETIFDRGRSVEELKRQVADESEVLRDTHALIVQLKSRVNIEAESVSIKEEAWTKEALLNVKFSIPNENVKPAGETKYQITFLSHQWGERFSALQYVLSDLNAKNLKDIKVLGQFDGRWIVDGIAEAVPPPSVKQTKFKMKSKPQKVIRKKKKMRRRD